jgi:hypothetical protein
METSFDSIIQYYNQKNEFVSKIWTWIAVLSIFGILVSQQPKQPFTGCASVNSGIEQITFPIIDMQVSAKYFVIVFTLILTGLIIRWVEAFQRSVSLRQEVIEKLLETNESILIKDTNKIETRTLLDGIVYSTTTSVWGLVPNFKHKNDIKFYSTFRKFTYIFLKVIVFAAHFLFPLFTLYLVAFSLINKSTPLSIKIITVIMILIATLVIISVTITEWKYSKIPFTKKTFSKTT